MTINYSTASGFTTKQAAIKLGVTQDTVRGWCAKGILENARRVDNPRGEYWLIPEKELENFKMPTRGRRRSRNPTEWALAKRLQRKREKVEKGK